MPIFVDDLNGFLSQQVKIDLDILVRIGLHHGRMRIKYLGTTSAVIPVSIMGHPIELFKVSVSSAMQLPNHSWYPASTVLLISSN